MQDMLRLFSVNMLRADKQTAVTKLTIREGIYCTLISKS